MALCNNFCQVWLSNFVSPNFRYKLLGTADRVIPPKNFLTLFFLFLFHSLDEASVFITEYSKHRGKPVPSDATPCEILKVTLARRCLASTFSISRVFEIEPTCSGDKCVLHVTACIFTFCFLCKRVLGQIKRLWFSLQPRAVWPQASRCSCQGRVSF